MAGTVGNATRYRIVELQDHQGNVVYPHTDAHGVWMDEQSLYELLNADVTDEQINNILNS